MRRFDWLVRLGVGMAAALLWAAPAAAQTWVPMPGGTYSWNLPANWDPAVVPNAADAVASLTADITGDQTVNLDAAITVGALNVGDASNGYTVGAGAGGTLTFSAGGGAFLSMTAGSVSQAITSGFALGSALTVAQNSTAGTLAIGGTVARGANAFTVGGAGNTTFSGDITGTTAGVFTKTGAGKVTFTSNTAFGSAQTPTVQGLNTTGNIVVDGGELEVGNVRLNGGQRAGGTRNLSVAAGAVFTSTGTIQLDPNPDYTQVISGAGTLRLRNAAASKASPSIAFDAGPGGGDAAPYGSIVGTAVDVGSGGTQVVTGRTNRNDVSRYAGDFRFDGPVVGSANLQVIGLNQNSARNFHFVLNGNNSGFTGGVLLANADLNLTNANALSGANPLTFNSQVDALTQNRAVLFLFGHSVTIGSLNDVSAAGTTSFIRNGALNAANGGTNTTGGGGGTALGLNADSVLTVNQTADGAFNGRINDGPNDNLGTGAAGTYRTLSITKAGPAVLTLAGSNAYTGPTTVTGGVLSVGTLANGGTAVTNGLGNSPSGVGSSTSAAANLVLGGGTLRYTGASVGTDRGFTLASGGGTVDVASAGTTAAFSGQVTGAGGLTKAGPGALGLVGAASDYTGPVAVNAGTLRVAPNASAGAYTVAGGAALAVSSPTNAGTLTAASAAFGNGSALSFELGTAGNPGAALFNVTGGLSVAAGGTATVGLSNSAGFAVGTFPLVDYAGSIGGAGFGGFALAPSRLGATLVNNAADTRVDVTITTLSDAVVWTGAQNGTWDVGTGVNVGGTNNWKLATSGTATNFIQGDAVRFDDTAPGTGTVSVAASVLPASTAVNNAAKDYTFTGPGSIDGTGGLTKSGAGTLTLATNNNYSGGTTVAAGTLQIGAGGTAGSVAGDVAVDGTLAFNRSDAAAFGGAVTGAGLVTQRGAGALTLSGPLSQAGGLAVTAGTAVLTGTNAYAGGTTVAANSTLQVGAGGAAGTLPGDVVNNGSLAFNRSDAVTFAGAVTGTGAVSKLGGSSLALSGANNTFAGGVTVAGGTLVVAAQGNVGSGPLAFAAANTALSVTGTAVTLANDVSLGAVNGRVTLVTPDNSSTVLNGTLSGGSAATELFFQGGTGGSVSGALTLNGPNTIQGTINVQRGPLVLGSAAAAGSARILLDSNIPAAGALQLAGNFTVPNAVVLNFGSQTLGVPDGVSAGIGGVVSSTGTLGFTKVGAGALTLTGANTYTGPTAVSAGTLLVNGGQSAATGAVTVGGGTLGGTGTVGGAVTVSAGTVRAGDESGAGTLTLANGLAVNAGASLTARTSAGAGGGPNTSNLLNVTGGTFAFDPLANVVIDGTGAALAPGQAYTYQVAQAAGQDLSGLSVTDQARFSTVGFAGGDFTYSLAGTAGGGVFVSLTPVPEPATVGLAAAAGLGAAGFARRRRSRSA